VAGLEPLDFGEADLLHLDPGSYLVTFNEVVNLPLTLTALGRTRSSLLRSGAALHTAVWDAGYSGRSQSLLVVYHAEGLTLHRDARIMQLVFFWLQRPVAEGYRGTYLGEHI
jgi:dUTP pyrophosphatase